MTSSFLLSFKRGQMAISSRPLPRNGESNRVPKDLLNEVSFLLFVLERETFVHPFNAAFEGPIIIIQARNRNLVCTRAYRATFIRRGVARTIFTSELSHSAA